MSGPPLTLVNSQDLSCHDHGRLVCLAGTIIRKRGARFMELKDQVGTMQLVAPSALPWMEKRFANILPQSFVRIAGRVLMRPNSSVNDSLSTGTIEVHVQEIMDVRKVGGGGASRAAGPPGLNRNFSTAAATASKLPPSEVNRHITAVELIKCRGFKNLRRAFETRSITCGELRLANVGQTVTLLGWIDNGRKSGRFVQLCDGHGHIQLVLDTGVAGIVETFNRLDDNVLVQISGVVTARPEGNRNTSNETGDIDIALQTFVLLDGIDEADGGEEAPQSNDQRPEPIKSMPLPSQSQQSVVNRFTNRTHSCGELREEHVGQQVTLCGWYEYGRMKKFLTLRDGYGSTQILIPLELSNTVDLSAIPFESVLEVVGEVVARPASLKNQNMKTGGIEVVLSKLTVVNRSRKNLPVEVRDFNRAKEHLRLENRYLDLRFNDMQKNLRTRSTVIMKMRDYLVHDCGFVEVETPTLFRRTPGVSLCGCNHCQSIFLNSYYWR